MTPLEMVHEYQCPGCVCGSGPWTCEEYKLSEQKDGPCFCENHTPGTVARPGGLFMLGLPKGFCKVGRRKEKGDTYVRLWQEGQRPDWNNCNVAVWAMVRDGVLYVRTYLPRVNLTYVDVIPGGTLALCPGALDVGTFYDEID